LKLPDLCIIISRSINSGGMKQMRAVIRHLVILVAFAGIVFGGYFLWDRLTQVSKVELEQVIQRAGMPFEVGSIPDKLLDQLASNRVVIVGEFHFLREHRELVSELVRELHSRGFRQYLFEWTQAADWLLADFVNDGGLLPEWTPPHDIGGDTITAIRNINLTLPESERIEVHGIDVHLPDYGGTDGWVYILGLLASYLPDQGPISAFLDGDHETDESHRSLLETLQAQLQDGRSDLIASWGDYWYDTVVEMVEVELRSIPIRASRESDYDESVRLREEAIHWLADRRISSNPGGTLINFGNTHAQKEGLWGTEGIEWLGDYLVHNSPATAGSSIALWVAATHIVSVPGSGNPDFDLRDSPTNELLRVMSQTWPEQSVFLLLDDPLFSDGRVPINVSGDIYVGAPGRQYDAILLLPVAHQDFVGD
jgi:hypothetical protein